MIPHELVLAAWQDVKRKQELRYQAQFALAEANAPAAIEQARAAYVCGDIELDRFESRVADALHGRVWWLA